nr:PREDICTED: brain protein I3 isoform X2 [Anolis carolinensis]|eukprot:XP_008122408.1 PREDICTED: brain protein I3 isoform X2 [Anolis carolinensis]
MESKRPLLAEEDRDRPPAYSPGAGGGGGGAGPHGNYGAIPHAPGYVVPPIPPPHSFPNTTYTIIQQPLPTTSVVVVGGCPACRVGVLEDTFTCLGVLCAIAFFPVGILFCLALRQRRCPNCGATFG